MENWIKSYKISVTGTSNGLTIPKDFVVSTDAIYVTGVNTTDNSVNLESQVNTYTDVNRSKLIINDDINSVQKLVGTITAIDSTNDKITVSNGLKQLLESVYGASNVTEIIKQ